MTSAPAATLRRSGRRLMAMMGFTLTVLWLMILQAGAASAQDFGLQNPPYPLPNCTSSSIKNVTITPIPGTTVGACTDPDDVVTVDVRVDFEPTASNVYDMLIGYASGGLVYWDDCLGDNWDPDGGNDFLDVDTEGDCGDARKVQGPYSGIKTVQVYCDSNQDGLIDADANVDFYFGWNQAAGGTGLPDDVNGPKCDGPYAVSIPLGPKISITKVANDGTGTFPFEVDNGSTVNTGFSPTLSDGESATSGDFLPAVSGGGYGDVTITELVPAGWDVSVSCTDNKGGAIDLSQADSGIVTIPGSILVNDPVQQVISCTYTNTNTIGTLEITKIMSDAAVPGFGEAANTWTLGYKDGGATIDSGTGTGDASSATITFADVPAGSYQLFEALAGDGYFYNANLVCTDGSGAEVYNDGGVVVSSGIDANFAGTVPVAAGETTSCTLTNTLRAGLLTLNKVVENNGADATLGTLGAPENWALIYSISGGAEQSASSGDIVPVPAGAEVTLREEARVAPDANALPLGLTYNQTGLSCSTGLTGDTVTVTTSAVCTFTNALEVATLTLDKVLVDPNVIGPLTEADFTISGSGTVNDVVLSGLGTSGADEVSAVVPAGGYSVTESPISADYDLAIDCGPAGSGAGPDLGISLASGDDVTCTLTNTYNKARLQITKQVVNDTGAVIPGADAWRMGYTGPESNSLLGTATTPIDVLVSPGDYAITEQLGGNGLTYDVAVDCGTPAATEVSDAATNTVSNVTLAAGDDVSCTVTNTLRSADLTLIKTVDSGALTVGTTVPGDWDLSFAGPLGGTVTTGVTTRVPVGDYTFSEDSAAAGAVNYDLASLTCGGVDATGGYTVTGDTTCTFANVANVAQVTLQKSVPDAGVLNAYVLGADNWDLTLNGATGNNTDPAVTDVLVPAGTVNLSESAGTHDLDYSTGLACVGAAGTFTYTNGDQSGSIDVAAGENVVCTFTNELQAGSLRVVKSVPANDLGVAAADWTMDFDGLATSNPFGDTIDVSGAGDTGSYDVPAGTYAISEALSVIGSDAHDSYVLTSVVCTDPVAGTIVEEIGSVSSPVTAPDVTVGEGQDVTCTFTNETAAARLTLTKAVTGTVDQGTLSDATDWTIGTENGATPISGITGSADVTGVLVTADTYDITESFAGSLLSYDVSLSCSGNATAETDAGATVTTGGTVGSVTLAAGETVTCDIVNDVETATITLEKSVAANALGVENTGWDLSFDGPGDADRTGVTATAPVTSVVVPAGVYALDEAQNGSATDPDYALYGLESITCGGADVTTASAVTLEEGDDVTCVFTNAATQGRLTLVKAVDDDGVAAGTTVPAATDWTLTASGTTPVTGAANGADVTYQPVTAGTYAISEMIAGGVLSYDAALSCEGNAVPETDAGATVTGAASADVGSVEVGVGEDVVCTITNTLETATLTLVKDVPANDLGVDALGWDLTFNGPGGATGTGENTEAAITAVSVPAGDYTLIEALNTLGNSDPDYGEYDLASLVCAGGADADGEDGLTLADGEAVTCTFLNTTTKARLTLVKDPIVGGIDAGTIPSEDDWTLSFAGTDSGTGSNTDATITSVVIEAGDYALTETLAGSLYGYDAALSCDNGASGTGTVAAGGDYTETGVAIAAGSDVTCTFTNTLQTATLTLVKSVDNGDFGTAAITDWDLRFDGPSDADGVGATGTGTVSSVVVPAGAYTLTEENGPLNYTLASLACDGTDPDGEDGLDLGQGEDVTCTFQNDITVARVTLVKDVQNPAALDGVALDEGSWDLTVDGGAAGNNGDASVTEVLVTPGDITLTEAAPGHDLSYASSLSCTGASGATVDNADVDGSGQVTVEAGDDVSCTFLNVLETATLTLVKDVAPNALGVTADGWNLTFTGAATSGITDTGTTGSNAVTTVTVPADTYTLTEALTPAVENDIDYQQYGLDSLVCEVNGVAGSDIKGSPDVALADGDTAVCTYVNAPNTAKVTLVKTLDIPAEYASLATAAGDWVLTVGGNSYSSDDWASQNVYLTPGDYSLSEANDGESFLYDAGITCDGGSVSDNGDGTGTFTLGDGDVGSDILCTFANELETATLTLVKQVDDLSVTAGTADATEWDLTYEGPELVTGTDVTGGADVTGVLVPLGSYTLSEAGTTANSDNYVQTGLTCNGADATGGYTVTGDTTCTFVNTINIGELILDKEVVNDSGGDARRADFTLSYNGTDAAKRTPIALAAGDYVLAETDVAGYEQTGLSCTVTGQGGSSFTGDTVSLAAGDSVSCLFVNDDIAPTFDMVKSVDPGFAQAGETVDYTFTFTNNGPWAITGLTVTDPLLGLTNASCGTSPLAAGASTDCSFPYTVTQEDVDGAGNSEAVDAGTCASGRGIPNTAVPSASETSNDGDPVDEIDATDGNNSVVLCLPGSDPIITVEKTIDIDGAAVGDVIDYAIAVSNQGNVTLDNVDLTDVLRDGDGTNRTAALSGPVLVSGDDGNGLLDVGETWIYDATVEVSQSDFDSGLLRNRADVTATAPNGDEVSDGPSRVTTTFTQSPDIALTKTGTLNDDDGVDGVTAGDTITYVFDIENTGDVTLSAVTLEDLTAGVVLTGSPIASLAPGETDSGSYTAEYVLTQDDIDAGTFRNVARVTGTAPSGEEVTDRDNDVQALEQLPALELTKTGEFDAGGDDIAQPGEIVTYTFRVRNTGNVTLTGVTIEDPLPGLSDIDPETRTIPVGESRKFTATYAVTQDDIDAGEVLNTATALSDQDVTDEDDAVVDLPQGPAISLEKRAVRLEDFNSTDPEVTGFNDFGSGDPANDNNGYADPGETISYSFEATNTGNVTLSDITLTDPLITDQGGVLTYVSGDTDGDGRMEVGDVWYFTGTYTITQADIEGVDLTNVAVVTGTGPKDDTVEDVSDDAVAMITLDANPDFSITVEVDEPSVTIGRETNTDTGEVTQVPVNQDEIDEDPTVPPQWTDPEILNYTIVVPNEGNVTLINPVQEFRVVLKQGNTKVGTLVKEFTVDPDGAIPADLDGIVLAAFLQDPADVNPLEGTGDLDGDGELDVDEIWVYKVSIRLTEEMARKIYASGPVRIDGIGTFDADDVRPGRDGLDPENDDDVTVVNIQDTEASSPGNDLDIVKTVVGRDTVRQGDIVIWQIEVTNNQAGAETLDVIDTLPTGFVYRAGTATVAGASVTPEIDGNRVIYRDVVVPGNASTVLRLSTFVSGRVKPGQYINYAMFVDDGGGSESDTATVIVGAEPVFDCGTVIGKVWDDKNQNGYQDAPSLPGGGAPAGLVMTDDIFSTSGYSGKGGKLAPPARPDPVEEPGIPGVRLVTADGKIITTDEYGRFHVACADLPRDIGSNFLLKLDTRSLPSGYRLTTENPRVVRLTAGKMVKMNFGATISRLVRIDIANNAFEPGTNTPKPAFVAALGRAVPQFANEPATVRISYLKKGEDRATINARSRNVERILRQYWRESGKYRLMIEKTVQRPR